MKIEKIKPIPKYIAEKIKKLDDEMNREKPGMTRYYSYLTKNDGELVKVTVAVKYYRNKWLYKQVAVHGIHSKDCFVKDMELAEEYEGKKSNIGVTFAGNFKDTSVLCGNIFACCDGELGRAEAVS